MEQKEKELQPQTRAYTVEEIAAILHIGRSSAYTLVKKGTSKAYALAQPSGSPENPLTSGWINWSCNTEERTMANPWYAPLYYRRTFYLRILSAFCLSR